MLSGSNWFGGSALQRNLNWLGLGAKNRLDLEGRSSRQDRLVTTQMRRSVPSAVIGQLSPTVARAEVGVRVGGPTARISDW